MHGACRLLDKEHIRRHVVSKGGCVVECRAAQLRVDRRHEELHQAYEYCCSKTYLFNSRVLRIGFIGFY